MNLAAALRGFGAPGIAAIVLIALIGNVIVGPMIVIPAGALLVLLWARLSRTPLSEIGYVRPRSATLVIAAAFGIALKFAMKSLVMPALGADPINRTYHFLAGNRALLPTAILAMCIVGFSEETVFRGFAFERLGKLLPSKIAIVLLTSLWFGVAHYSGQGVAGVQQGAIVGLALGTIYAASGEIWTVMLAHATFDLTALAMIYWNVESAIAHLVFK
jgi:membrane protease YdiL (CAAX protease family)